MTFLNLVRNGNNHEEDNPHESQPSEELRLTNHESTYCSHDLDKEQLETTIRKKMVKTFAKKWF